MKRSLIFFLIAISLLSVMLTIYQRFNIEKENKRVEIVLDYKEIEALSRQSNKDFSWWLQEFQKLGATSVALEEESLESLVKDNKDVEVHLLGNLTGDVEWIEKYDNEFVSYILDGNKDKYDVIAITKSQDLYDFILKGLTERYPKEFYRGIKGDKNYYIVLDGEELDALYTQAQKIINYEGKPVFEEKTLYSSKVARIGLGFDPEKIEIIKDSGLNVLPRPINFNRYPEELMDAFNKELIRYDINPSTIIFSGNEFLGYEKSLEDLISFMKNNNIRVGMIENSVQREHIEQEGLEEVVEALDYNAVRVFSVWPYIQERFKYYNYEGAEEIENTLYRAVTERNIRLIYFKPFKEEEFKYVTDFEEYEKMFNNFEARIKNHGMILGKASTMDSYNIGTLRLSLIGFGVLAAGLLILDNIFDLNRVMFNMLSILGIIFVLLMSYLIPSLADKLFALSASIVFPTLGATYLVNYAKDKLISLKIHGNIFEIIKNCIVVLLICTAISTIGGFFVGSTLSHIKYLLEMDIFRGVKASQLMPIILFTIIYIFKFGYNRDIKELSNKKVNLKDFINLIEQNIKIKHLIMVGIVAIAGFIYISRTGHETTVQPSDLEMIVRNFLENILLARPRTKEFLIAFPALMASVYMAHRGYKKLLYPLFLAGVIGLSSIVNTFSHLRTPVYLSLIRTLYSIAFGIIIGLIGIILIRVVEELIYSFERSKS